MQPRAPARRDDPAIVAIIRQAADRHGVPRQVALAFAWCESRLNHEAEGDLQWHERKGGELYRKHVLEAGRLEQNPCRNMPQLWHSYGLFQLLACYHCGPDEHPGRLLNPVINADRACAEIARLLRRSRGDVRAARLAYVGCGFDGKRCDERHVSKVVDALTFALHRYATEEGVPRGKE